MNKTPNKLITQLQQWFFVSTADAAAGKTMWLQTNIKQHIQGGDNLYTTSLYSNKCTAFVIIQPTYYTTLEAAPQNSQEGSLLLLEHLYCTYAEACDPTSHFPRRVCPDSHTTASCNDENQQWMQRTRSCSWCYALDYIVDWKLSCSCSP